MRKFWLGCIVAIVILLVTGFCYVRFGFVNPPLSV